MTESCVDQQARDEVRDVRHGLNNHKALSAVEYRQLEKKIDLTHADTATKIEEIKSAIKWAGGLIISLMITVLGWAVLQQINANEAQKQEMQRQIILLQQQEDARRLSASAPEPAVAPVSPAE